MQQRGRVRLRSSRRLRASGVSLPHLHRPPQVRLAEEASATRRVSKENAWRPTSSAGLTAMAEPSVPSPRVALLSAHHSPTEQQSGVRCKHMRCRPRETRPHPHLQASFSRVCQHKQSTAEAERRAPVSDVPRQQLPAAPTLSPRGRDRSSECSDATLHYSQHHQRKQG
jgi:hypothetical protein